MNNKYVIPLVLILLVFLTFIVFKQPDKGVGPGEMGVDEGGIDDLDTVLLGMDEIFDELNDTEAELDELISELEEMEEL
ncbi:MAG: hypothetical protein U9Q22_02380 [Candidatus Altiarchaeota archaeon]|nr:hypothetical protein [Candidatus Altiarchaeota archaeon]